MLVIGYGNPGRLDDGLGPAFASAIERMEMTGVTVDSNYQLTVEDAATVAEHDVVVFADASVVGPDPFSAWEVEPAEAGIAFTSHGVQPPELMGLARQLFGAKARGYAVAIRGHEFNEFGERLSEQATRNLTAALRALQPIIAERRFDDLVARYGTHGGPDASLWEDRP